MNIFKVFRPQVLESWHSFCADFNMQPTSFYESVEKELTARKIPALDMSRVEWLEGGALSAKRLYLRLTREKWVFDICAAPFGTGFFFSYRFTELPLQIIPLLVLALVVLVIGAVFAKVLGFFFGFLVYAFVLVLFSWCLKNLPRFQLPDLDSFMIRVPGLGDIYERFLRNDSYYREDTRLMYLATVPAVVKKLSEDATLANGVKQPSGKSGVPVLKELSDVV